MPRLFFSSSSAFFAPLALILFAPVGAQDDRSALTPLDVAKLRQVRSVHPSPDGRWLAFVRSEPRLANDAPGADYSNLWLRDLESGAEHLMLGGSRSVGGVSWDPRGEGICFTQRGPGAKHSEVWMLPMPGGEARPLTATPSGVRTYRISPDGRFVAFTVLAEEKSDQRLARELGFSAKVKDEGWRQVELHVWDRDSGEVRALVQGGSVFAFEWAPGGRRLLAAIAPTPSVDDSYMGRRLHVVDVQAGDQGLLSERQVSGKLGAFAWSPDGSRIAYVGAFDRRDPHAGSLYLAEVGGGALRLRTEGLQGMVEGLTWVDANHVLAHVARGVHDALELIPIQGDADHLDRPEGSLGSADVAIDSFARHAGSGKVYAVASTPTHPNEAFVWEEGAWQRLTDSNPWLAEKLLTRQSIQEVTTSDELEIEGLLLHPGGYEEGRRYPLVIVAHGGPESHFSNGWLTSYGSWGQLLSARGYFVWYPNYRASTGYGVEFAKADHGDPMGKEFQDHLDAIDLFVAAGWVDRDRVGIGGGSYGGYTAAWAATRHTQHFAAAVSFVPFVDIRSKWYTSDIPTEFFFVHYEEKWPHQQKGLLAERSPLTYANACRTPLLLLGGDADPRVHPSQPFMLYSAVKTAAPETPVRYVVYPGEGHGNRINVNRYDYCVRTLRWFEYYLGEGASRTAEPPTLVLDLSAWAATR